MPITSTASPSVLPRAYLDNTPADALNLTVAELSIHQTFHRPTKLRVSFFLTPLSDWNDEFDALFSGGRLSHGTEIRIDLSDTEATRIFQGTLYATSILSGTDAPVIEIVAADALEQLNRAPRSRTFENLSVAEIISRIADEYDLVADINLSNDFTREATSQINQTDLDFLMQLAYRVGGDVRVWENTLNVQLVTHLPNSVPSLTMNDFEHLRITSDAQNQPHRVIASGWDALKGEAVRASGTSQFGDTDVDNPSGVLTHGQRYANTFVQSTEEAGAVARAAYQRRHRKFLDMEGQTEFRTHLQVGNAIWLNHIAERFSGTYYITRATHTYSTKYGFRSHICADGLDTGDNHKHRENNYAIYNRSGTGRRNDTSGRSFLRRTLRWLSSRLSRR